MKLCSSINRIMFVLCLVVFVMTAFLNTPVSAQEPFENAVCIEYTLPNGYSYKLKPSIVDTREPDNRSQVEISAFEYVFVLPKAVAGRNIKMYCAEEIVTEEGEILSAENTVLDEGIYTVKHNDTIYTVRILYASDIPQIYITLGENELEKVHEDKEYSASGYITVTEGESIVYDGSLEYLRGRGNATWNWIHKPYNIKLATKINLLGMNASKKYALITNYQDYTAMRNNLTFDLARKADIPYTSQTRQVDLYIDGEYRGNYTLTQRVEVDESSVNILNLDELNEFLNPDVDFDRQQVMGDNKGDAYERAGGSKWIDVPNEAASQLTGGYLIELDLGSRYDEEKTGFVSNDGQPVVIKSPKTASKKQVEYIQNYYQNLEDALLSDDGYNSIGVHYSEYIDVQSMAKMYVFQEYVQNIDASITSFYLYKEVDGKLMAGPIWDMDMSLGCSAVRFDKNLSDTDNIWAADGRRFACLEGRTLLSMLWQHADFRRAAAQQWQQYFSPQIQVLAERAQQLERDIEKSVTASQYIWKNDRYNSDIDSVISYYHQCAEQQQQYITGRAVFMEEFLDMDNNFIMYARNGAEGVTLDPKGYKHGDTGVVIENNFLAETAGFIGWNTHPDGSGEWYYPGDNITVNGDDITLFAQWDGVVSDYVYREPPVENKTLLQILVNFFENLI